MNKIKLPLYIKQHDSGEYGIYDNNGDRVGHGFLSAETAQLFADCFDFCAVTGSTQEYDNLKKMPMVCIRAAEAVEG